MAAFRKRVLFLGYGAVARCALPLFIKHVQVPLQNVTVVDFEDRSGELRPWTAQGVRFVHDRVTPENLGRLLDEFLSDGDLLVDLAWNIDCGELLEWCRRRGVLYVNTSIEVWDPYAEAHKKRPTERTLYWRQMKLRRLIGSWSRSGPTAVLEHGANPGLISHWTKQGLVDLAERILDDRRAADGEAEKIRHWVKTRAVQPARAGPRRESDPLQRVGHASDRPAQGGRRIRQHLEHRGFSRGGDDHGGVGLGHAREGIAPRGLRTRGRPEEPNLPRADGHEHLGPLLGPPLHHPRHGDPPRRGIHDLRFSHRLGGRPSGLSPDRPLRLLPLRRGDRLAARVARAQLPLAAEPPHPPRRDRPRVGHPRRC